MVRESALCLYTFLFLWGSQATAGDTEGRLGMGFGLSTQKLYGDTYHGDFAFGGNPLIFRYNLKSNSYVESDIAFAKLSTQLGVTGNNADLINLGLNLGYRILSETKVTPLFYLGIGTFNYSLGNSKRQWAGYGAIGIGAEIVLSKAVGLNFTGDYRLTTSDDFDGRDSNILTDGFLGMKVGLIYYSGGAVTTSPPPLFGETSEDEAPFVQEIRAQERPMEGGRETVSAGSQDPYMLMLVKDELQESIRQKEQFIRLFKIKLRTLTESIKLLEDRIELNGGAEIRESPDDYAYTRLRDALKFYEVGEYEDAIKILTQLLKENPKHAQAGNWWYWLGESYYAAQDYQAAVNAFEMALIKNQTVTKLELKKLMLALSRYHAGDIQQAKIDFQNHLRDNPNSDYRLLIEELLSTIK